MKDNLHYQCFTVGECKKSLLVNEGSRGRGKSKATRYFDISPIPTQNNKKGISTKISKKNISNFAKKIKKNFQKFMPHQWNTPVSMHEASYVCGCQS